MIDIAIIGAGAAGLSAASILSEAGHSVCICEARNRIGGRIHTIKGEGFSVPVEAGAEFMHGELPLTQVLLKEANISYQAGGGQTWNVEKHRVTKGDLFDGDWGIFIKRLQQLKDDITIGDFLKRHFSDPKYESLVQGINRFVEGYDAADVDKASALALHEEWTAEDIQGYRPIGGYAQLVEHLLSDNQRRGVVVKLATVIKKISWKRDSVELQSDNEKITAQKVLVTIPVSVLKTGMVQFDPPLQQHQEAFQMVEVGGVIKFLVEFKQRIWETPQAAFNQMPGLNFLFSDAFVPTWWTQSPSKIPLLTGWLAGPIVRNIQHDENSLLSEGIASLAYLFGCKREHLEKEITAARVINWYTDPYARGAYAYKTLKTTDAILALATPVDDTIYFAGEALYDGPEMGTVEAALGSGKNAALKMIKTNHW